MKTLDTKLTLLGLNHILKLFHSGLERLYLRLQHGVLSYQKLHLDFFKVVGSGIFVDVTAQLIGIIARLVLVVVRVGDSLLMARVV